MTLDDVLGRVFETTNGSGHQFVLSGVVPEQRIVRLTPIGATRSQRVVLPVFMAALYSGAIQEIAMLVATERTSTQVRYLRVGDRLCATGAVVRAVRQRVHLSASKREVELADVSGVVRTAVWNAATTLTVERVRTTVL